MSEVAPWIATDIRYAREFNFTGGVVPGYEAAECIVTEATAAALIAAEESLNADGYGLILFDCYRPQRAVDHFLAWAGSGKAGVVDEVFLPGIDRNRLIGGGYIAARSSHRFGATVDVGLRRIGDPMLYPQHVPGQRCDGPVAERPMDSSLNLGTSFDCFSPLSALDAAVPEPARRNRERLRQAMQDAGFASYAAEWWHFRHATDPAQVALDIAVD